MAIKNWLITGDTHGCNCDRMSYVKSSFPECNPNETAVVILGDAGFNYYLDKSDLRRKKYVSEYGYTIYCVYGNHEARPGEHLGMHLVNDDNVGGPVWIEDEFPLIRYFCEWGHYDINGRKVLVIGGAYSVDKWYRLQNGWKWFEDEQLKEFEMNACYRNAIDYQFDIILSHTCPASLQPTDMFLRMIDQSTVDNTMEVWMDTIRKKVRHRLWLWGHYHGDRIEAPYCEMFYTEVERLEDIEARWKKYDETGELDWWLPASPKMKKIMNKE